jgi:hypothetical protein
LSVLVPPFPSISPGEKPARSTSTCYRKHVALGCCGVGALLRAAELASRNKDQRG